MFDFFKKKNKQEQTVESYQSFGTGELIPLHEVPDKVFAEKMMGDGFAINLTDGKVYAPISGTIAMAFPTGHAVGIKTESGQEILLHFGIDTVELQGEGFKTTVKEGDKIKQGDLLSTLDLELIKERGKSVMSMMIFTSGEAIELLKPHAMVTPEDTDLFRLEKAV